MTTLQARFDAILPQLDIVVHSPRPVIAGLSGGADSVALVALLKHAGVCVVAAHANFGLRGQESERDQQFTIETANLLGVECRVKRFEVDPTQGGVEEKCRRLRYAWFNRLASELDAQAVAVGHHRRDQAETMLLNLLDRRSGISGLRAMKPRNGIVARPLLNFDPNEIRAWLLQNGLTWVDDSSNNSLHYRRNVMRHQVIPALEKVMDNRRRAVDSLAASAANLADDERLLDSLAAATLSRHSTGNEIFLSSLLDELGPQTASLLARAGLLPRRQAQQAADAALKGLNGLQFGRYTLHNGVLYAPLANPKHPACSIEVVDSSQFNPNIGPECAWFDEDARLKAGARMEWRTPRPGEKFATFGLHGHGSRRISDLLKEAAVPACRRSTFMMLCLDDTPAWLPGIANSALLPVNQSSTSILKIQLLK